VRECLDSDVERSLLVDLKQNKEAFVIGVVLKKMKYRRSVLYEFLDEDTLETDVRERIQSGTDLACTTDYLELEDSHQVG